MKRDENEFEMDEPATETHTPPGWPIQILELTPNGHAPKKYGSGTFRFGAALTLSVILPRRGWTLVKKTKNYVYLIPPGDQPSPPFRISIAVPTPEHVMGIAVRSYRRGKSWLGQLGEWPAWYFHERNTDMREIWRDSTTGEMRSLVHSNPPQSSLSIGEFGVWNIDVTGVAGEFTFGVLPPPLVPKEAPTVTAPLFEGATRALELTTYERNEVARRLCLAHYGLRCQACGMSFEERYGTIGADLIHVHHVVPLAARQGEYEVDPIRDLVPLCANCHQVVHRRAPPYSVGEVRNALRRQDVIVPTRLSATDLEE